MHARRPPLDLTRRDEGLLDAAAARLSAADVTALRPRTTEERARTRSIVDVRLDPAQEEAARLPAGRHVLLLGEAGHGKTTAALHRLSHLARSAHGRFRPLVLVPAEGLRQLLVEMTKRLGLDVPVLLYDRWARRQARRAFADVPRRESVGATPAVIGAKRDPALRVALEELAALPPGRVDDDEDAEEPATSGHARRADLQHLFGDRVLMERVAAASKRALARAAVADVLEHTRVQFDLRSEEAYAHVDKERLVTVDRRAIDEGTPDADAGTIDAEDYAVLFELDRLRAARAGEPPTAPRAYDCIVLDEAQELAPLELALIGRSLAPGGSLVVAGDADQQLDPAVAFTSWADTMKDLGCGVYETRVLAMSYRCPTEVVAFARGVLAPERAASLPIHRFDDEHARAAWLAAELDRLLAADEGVSVAVVCRSPLAARRLAALLRHFAPCRLVLDGGFHRGAGVQVTSVEQVKGLEFDHVVVPDLGASPYPDTPESRRALYVAVTRARHQVVLAAVGAPSPLVRMR